MRSVSSYEEEETRAFRSPAFKDIGRRCHLQAGRESLVGTEISQHLDLGFCSHQNYKKQKCFLSHAAGDFLLRQLKPAGYWDQPLPRYCWSNMGDHLTHS